MMLLNQQQQQPLVSFAAVSLGVTQRSPQQTKGKECGAGLSTRFFGESVACDPKRRLKQPKALLSLFGKNVPK